MGRTSIDLWRRVWSLFIFIYFVKKNQRRKVKASPLENTELTVLDIKVIVEKGWDGREEEVL